MNNERKNRVAMTPPMGWNSWDCYGASVNEETLLKNAAWMAEHLKPYGWEYIVCDIEWSEPTADSTEYHPFADLCMDEYSRLIPAPNRFPSAADGKGFAPIAEKIHATGLKFGIHIMRGIPRQAVHRNTPVLGTEATARDLAHPYSCCRWNTDMYGINPQAPGAQAYYDSIFQLYAEWGVDYVKVDDICDTNNRLLDPYSGAPEIEMIRRAIDRCGRGMVLSLSPGPAPIEHAWHLKEHANMWRITDDLWDDWRLLKAMFERCEVWQSHVGPGCWPDCDMLPLGVIRCFQPFYGEETRFTRDERITLMTLWCIFRSPLMMGGDLPRTDEWTLSLLTNPEVLRLTNRACAPRQVLRTEEEAVWTSKDENGSTNIALFNLSEAPRKMAIPGELLPDGGTLRDLWAKKDLPEDERTFVIPPHGARLFAVKVRASISRG